MKKIPMFYQVFIYMIGLTFILLGLVFVVQRYFLPSVYTNQQQTTMQETFLALDVLFSETDNNTHTQIYDDYRRSQTYDIYVYDIYGEQLFTNQDVQLLTSTIIEVNEGPILSQYFDGRIPYLMRIEKTDQYIYQVITPVAGLYQTIDVLNSLYSIIFITGIVVSLIISTILSNTLTKPIQKLTKMSQSLEETSLLLPRKDEIGTLSMALESLRLSLNQTIQRLHQELSREKTQDKLTKVFVANVAHEYQTPLAIISGAIEMLTDHPNLSKQETQHYMNMIQDEIKHLEALSKDILYLSKIHTISDEASPVHLHEMIHKVIEELLVLHPDIIIRQSFDAKSDSIKIPETRFKQVLLNVILNAIKHKDDGDISITTTQHKKTLTLTISNQTKSLTEDDLPHIFDTFYKKASNGHGLGLAIVKSILDQAKIDYGFYLNNHRIHFYMVIEGVT